MHADQEAAEKQEYMHIEAYAARLMALCCRFGRVEVSIARTPHDVRRVAHGSFDVARREVCPI